MKRFLFAVISALLAASPAFSQVIKGRITDQSGAPIPYATVYISQLKQGTTANTKGDYEIKLPAGTYEVTYQSMSYQQVNITITLSNQTITKDVALPMQYYQIPEVRISASGEDPAYIIMRKVIGMAPYYLNYVKHYKAEVYLKGNLVIKKIPKLIQKSMKIEDPTGKDIKLKPGDAFFMESYNEITFDAPDKYYQRVLSINSTFPDAGNEISPMEFIQASFYQPEIADMAISPLSPAAFSHYKFRYIGMSQQGNYTINKIQVIPKRKSQQLFEGTIYIIEDLWCLHSVDLVNENLAGRIRVQQLYVPVEDNIWMPVSHNFDVNIEFMGIQADAGYGSSVKYLEVEPDPNLKRPETITTNSGGRNQQIAADTTPKTKTEKEISKILQKDELNNRDMVRLSKLMKKKAEKVNEDTTRNPLEVKQNTIHEIDRNSIKKDSAYWAGIRPIPLSEIEKKSLRVSDSLKAAYKLRTKTDSSEVKQEVKQERKQNKFLYTLRGAALGHTWSDSTGKSFHFGGLANLKNFSFNTVDGFIYGLDFRLNKNWRDKQLTISPTVKWAFSRERPIWQVDGFYKFNRFRQSQVYIRTGQASVDFNRDKGINLFMNMNFSLLLRKNNLKLYESQFLTAGYKSDIANGLNLEIAGTFENRKTLNNNTTFSLFRSSRQYTENVPVNEYLLPGGNPLFALRNMRHMDLTANVTWTPRQKYRIVERRRFPMGSDWPTFMFTWMHGVNEFSELSNPWKHFDMLRAEAKRREDLGAFSEMRWTVRTGGFLNNKYITFYDFYHVNTQNLPLLLNDYDDAFMLPGYYTMSTPEFFVQGHLKYTTPYILLKYLPFLSNTLMRENLSFSYMGSRKHQNYWEAGYSMSEIFLLAEAGVFVGFDDLKFRSAGFVLVLKFGQ
ncbi:MAG TPA: DUF5686 and carboxypeptidase regulatory-like domain-containing protein [Bacteroidales bacterium]|nr:DUF5686 and carboxypeptidase regulatory-like domain-containing protein [Bacteroidales bacterium]